MPEHSIPDADSTWATDPLDSPADVPAPAWDDPLPAGNGTGPDEFPVPAELPEPVREVADKQPGTWPTSFADLLGPETAPDQPERAEPSEPGQPSVDFAAVLAAAVQGSPTASPVTTPSPAFRAMLRIDDEPTGVARVELTATGSAGYVNAVVESAMMAFMEEAKR